jgi:hypothetical protein
MRPQMALTEQTVSFMDFLAGQTDDFPVSRRERFDRWVGIRASMSLAPEWAQRLTGTHVPAVAQRWWLQPSDRFKAAVVRWSVPELPCKRMAMARATRAAEAPRDAQVA